jgi:hypothetical protein
MIQEVELSQLWSDVASMKGAVIYGSRLAAQVSCMGCSRDVASIDQAHLEVTYVVAVVAVEYIEYCQWQSNCNARSAGCILAMQVCLLHYRSCRYLIGCMTVQAATTKHGSGSVAAALLRTLCCLSYRHRIANLASCATFQRPHHRAVHPAAFVFNCNGTRQW